MVFGAVLLRDFRRKFRLIQGFIVKADRERLHRPIHQLAHECHNQPRVYAPAKQRYKGNVAVQPNAHRIFQKWQQSLGGFLFRTKSGFLRPQPPVTRNSFLPVLPDKKFTGPKLSYALENCPRRRHVPETEVIVQRNFVYFPANPRILKQTRQFGAENKLPADLAVIKRLLAGSIARQQKLLLIAIPDRPRKTSLYLL